MLAPADYRCERSAAKAVGTSGLQAGRDTNVRRQPHGGATVQARRAPEPIRFILWARAKVAG